MKPIVFALLISCATLAAAAQETGAAVAPAQQPNQTPPVQHTGATSVFTNEVRLQTLIFGNFFQAAEGTPSQNVDALGAAYRATYRPAGTTTDLYGEASLVKYTNISRERPYGLRAGVRHSDPKQEFEFFGDRGGHRAAFDVGDHTAVATITTLSGDYSYKVTPSWSVGGEAVHERQRFDVESNQANEYTRAGVNVRYRGWGYKFTPKVGYVKGRRNVDDRIETYDEDYWYAQVAAIPTPRVYLSLTYRDRNRKYVNQTDPLAREVARPQWNAFGSLKLTKMLTGTLYYSHEVSRSPLFYRRFTTSFLQLGVTARF